MAGQDVKQLCLALMNYFRDLLVALVAEDSAQLVDLTPEEAKELKGLAQNMGQEKLQRCFHLLMETEREIRYAASPQVILEMALLKMASLRPLVAVADILAKVRSIEASLGLSTPESPAKDNNLEKRTESPPPPVPPDVEPPKVAEPPSSDLFVSSNASPQPVEVHQAEVHQKEGLWEKLMEEVESGQKTSGRLPPQCPARARRMRGRWSSKSLMGVTATITPWSWNIRGVWRWRSAKSWASG